MKSRGLLVTVVIFGIQGINRCHQPERYPGEGGVYPGLENEEPDQQASEYRQPFETDRMPKGFGVQHCRHVCLLGTTSFFFMLERKIRLWLRGRLRTCP